VLPIVQDGVENTRHLMINYSTAYFGEKWSKPCTITALVLRICTGNTIGNTGASEPSPSSPP
jgi:hypothetical protein